MLCLISQQSRIINAERWLRSGSVVRLLKTVNRNYLFSILWYPKILKPELLHHKLVLLRYSKHGDFCLPGTRDTRLTPSQIRIWSSCEVGRVKLGDDGKWCEQSVLGWFVYLGKLNLVLEEGWSPGGQ